MSFPISHNAQAASADPAVVLELLEGFRRSQLLFAAVRLGVFERAWPVSGQMSRLLDACVSLGLLEIRGEHYVNTPVADQYLRDGSASSLAAYARFSAGALYPLWGALTEALSAPPEVWRQSPALADAARAVRGARMDFLLGMHGTGSLAGERVLAFCDFSGKRRLVDLGGATGYLALAAKRRYPDMEVIVFELPDMVAIARELGFACSGIEFLAGDVEVDDLPEADVYVLGRLVHNLDDADAGRLLERVHAVVRARGTILLAERLVPDVPLGGSCDVFTQDLNMLLCTGGRERKAHEYVRLLEKAGFADIRCERTDTVLDAIVATRMP